MLSKIPMTKQSDWWPDMLQPLRAAGSRIHDFFAPDAEAGVTDAGYEIKVELPGVKEGDIDISLDDNVLTIRGEKHSEKKEEGKSYYFSERVYGSFQRVFQLPGDVKADDIKAHFEDGVLEVMLPKRTEPVDKSTKISIGKK